MFGSISQHNTLKQHEITNGILLESLVNIYNLLLKNHYKNSRNGSPETGL